MPIVKKSKEKITNAAIYASFPSSIQLEDSVSNQLADCTAYCEQHGYVVTGSYAEESPGSRAQYDQLIADVKAGKFDCVIAQDVNNIVIDEPTYYELKATLSKLCVALHFVADNYDASPESGIMENFKVYLKSCCNRLSC